VLKKIEEVEKLMDE
jgi:hypothetical protein